MVKRGLLLLFVVAAALLSLLAGSSAVSAALFGCDDDSDCSGVWEVSSDGSGCEYGFECAGNWWYSSCQNPSTETCSYQVGTTYDSFGDGYTVVCDNGGCNYVLTEDCNIQDGCANNLYDDYDFNINSYKCDKSTSCLDSCCPTGQKCEGGVCKVPPPVCIDKDGDGYGQNCAAGTDCNDASSAVYPGSCSSGAVTWTACGTSTTGGCGSGTCTRALPSGCGDVCGDSKVTGSEGCDWGSGSVWGNGVWAPKWVSCPGGYDQAYGQYTCKSDCSGLEYDYVCQSCGDGTCNGPETKTSCAADCEKCGDAKVTGDEGCDWGISSGGWGNGVWAPKWVSCPGGYDQAYGQYRCKADCSGLEYDYACQSCGDGTCNGPETKETCVADCGKCGNGVVDAGEKCEPGLSTGVKSCGSGYGSLSYGCKSDCTWEDPTCPSCGDGTCNGPETKTSCSADCGKCGNGVTDAGEVCDPGSLVTGSKTQSCGSGYPSVTATCKSDCSAYDYVCQSCGDSIVNGPEVCEAGQTKACPGGGTVSCKSLECKWLECPATCTDGVKNQDETGVDCGGSCVGGSEVCKDGVDNDKDCLVDEGCAVVVQATCTDSVKNQDETGVDCGGSCVGGSEVCNDGVDNDKDCLVDEGCPTCSDGVKNGGEAGVDCGGTCTVPSCSKSVGVCIGKVRACSASGWVDCSEASYGANPNYQAAEITCDNLDNDCDGSVDEGCDDDNDEFCDSSMTWSGMVLSGTCAVASAGDCNDNNANINPGAVDVCGNGVDENCIAGDEPCPVLDPCAGVEKDSSQTCCASAGFQWVKSGEANVGSDKVDNQFTDSRGERKATSKLLPNEYRCFGDDADEQFFVRTRDCRAGVCTSSAADKSLCDKLSDCVYSGKCYSDIEAVASTFFGGSVGAVWLSSWQREVTADVNGDGRLEVCDPGEWQSPAGTVAGAVRNVSASNGQGLCPVQGCPVAGALVKVLGTSPLLTATTAADGSYSIANVPLGTYDLTASRPVDGYEDSAVLNQELVSGAVTVGFTLVRARGGCEDDCTVVGSNRCDASCHGKGLCWFYNGAAKAACDGTFGIVDVPGGQSVECCKGRPYTPLKADVTVKAKQVIKTVRPILYKGKLVKLVTLLFIPEK